MSLILTEQKLYLTLLLFTLLTTTTLAQSQAPKENQPVRNVYFKDIQQQTHSLQAYRGKWVFVNYWAGYCAICAKEIPTLIRFQQENPDRVAVLGVNYGGESVQVIKADAKRLRFNYPIIPGQENILNNFGEVVGTPTTVIISPQGRFIKKVIGRQTLKELYSYIKTNHSSALDDISN